MNIRVKITRDKSNAIKTMDLEEYLRGCVPSEMPATWHSEALKAQTLAARTYAMHQIASRKSKDYDVDDTVNFQAYKIGNYHDSTDKAIKETAGQYITYNGKLIDAVYSSSNGGHVKSAESRWGNKIAYLIAKDDPYDKHGGGGHGVGMSQYGADAMAAQGKTYPEILQFYYPGTKVEGIPATNEPKPPVVEPPAPAKKYATIEKGADGALVEELQTKLNGFGWALKVDGDFGPKTNDAVEEFQKLNSLEVDGIVGPKTWAKINSGNVVKKTSTTFKVRITANALNLRSGDGTNHTIIGITRRGAIHTIVQKTADGHWGKNSNGQWLSLKYAEVVK